MAKSRDKIDTIKERSAEALRKNLVLRRIRAKAVSQGEVDLSHKGLQDDNCLAQKK